MEGVTVDGQHPECRVAFGRGGPHNEKEKPYSTDLGRSIAMTVRTQVAWLTGLHASTFSLASGALLSNIYTCENKPIQDEFVYTFWSLSS